MQASQTVDSIKLFKKEITTSYLVFNNDTKALESSVVVMLRALAAATHVRMHLVHIQPAVPWHVLLTTHRTRITLLLRDTLGNNRQTKDIGGIEIGVCAAVFLLMSAVAHGIVLAKFNWYLQDLARGINRLRWCVAVCQPCPSAHAPACPLVGDCAAYTKVLYVCTLHLDFNNFNARTHARTHARNIQVRVCGLVVVDDRRNRHALWLLRLVLANLDLHCERNHELLGYVLSNPLRTPARAATPVVNAESRGG